MTPTPVVIDCDPGTDDAIGLLLALGAPGLDVLAVTAVGGNADVEITAENARRVVALSGRPVPVWRGSETPLDVIHRFGSPALSRDGRRDRSWAGLGLSEAGAPLADGHAVDALIELFTAAPDGLTVVATGPLTNVASALYRFPQGVSAIARLIVMGGTRTRGNTANGADFNFWADPAAARFVLSSPLREVTQFPLDVTRTVVFDETAKARIRASGAVGREVERLLQYRSATSSIATADAPNPPATAHDVVCSAHLVRPVLLAAQRCRVSVAIDSAKRRGHCRFEATPDGPVEVAERVDTAGVLDAVVESTMRLSTGR